MNINYGLSTIAELLELLKKHDKAVKVFYDDPMTHAMHVPTEDFQADFDRTEREVCSALLKKSPKDSFAQTLALDRLEAFMP